MPDTRTAEIHLSESGIVMVRIRKGARQSIPDAKENLVTAVAAAAGVRRPILVDIRGAQPLAADVRRTYSGETVAHAFSALALLIEGSPFGRLMGNVYFSVAQLAIPMKMFVDESQALEWLEGMARQHQRRIE